MPSRKPLARDVARDRRARWRRTVAYSGVEAGSHRRGGRQEPGDRLLVQLRGRQRANGNGY